MASVKHFLDMPEEILLKIFEYVPNKLPLKKSCQYVYEVICKIQMKHYRLVLKDDNLSQYKMILRSRRVFDEVQLNVWNFNEFTMQRLTSVLARHRDSIRKIGFKFAAINEQNLIQLLNKLPNIEEIIIDVCLLSSSTVPNQQRLSQLKRLESFTCKVESAKLIFELPKDVLKKLSFESVLHEPSRSAQLLQAIFEHQSMIEELSFSPSSVDPSVMRFPQLKKLRLLHVYKALSVLQNQKNLTSLDLQKTLANDDFPEICKLKCLQSLTVEVSHAEISNLSDLKQLRQLRLTLTQSEPCNDFQHVKLPCLERFECRLKTRGTINAFHVTPFPMNFPNLKHLTLLSVHLGAFGTLLQNKRLEYLCLEDLKVFNVPIYPIEIVETHEHLKELRILSDAVEYDFNLISKCVPNLEKIWLINTVVKDLKAVQQILENCKRLTHVKVINTRGVSTAFDAQKKLVRLLEKRGTNLTHFEYKELNVSFDVAKLKKLFDKQFEFISADKQLVMKNRQWK